ncbi:MAG: hypothetical protein KatS3mg082_3380 [Nitrospiraceae bacterium]|nr:MAG: hypothetical protein KatS3mg082_3380 [Nitrospiraceae bacterium]
MSYFDDLLDLLMQGYTIWVAALPTAFAVRCTAWPAGEVAGDVHPEPEFVFEAFREFLEGVEYDGAVIERKRRGKWLRLRMLACAA